MSYQILNMDCIDAMQLLIEDNSVDAIVTDPPYGLSFMGKKWDYDVPSVDVWREAFRVLKPGGHLLAFAGTRTQHRMAVNIEDAGFEIRDMLAWVYGCLDEATEVATADGVKPYHKTRVGDLVLCYDARHGEYRYQPILEIVEYEYSDTAYRLIGDSFEQVVSRNHRVITEQGGSEAFRFAETLGAEACVPVLESLPELQQALRDAHARTSGAEQDLRPEVHGGAAERAASRQGETARSTQRQDDHLCGMQSESMETSSMVAQGAQAHMQPKVQRGSTGRGMEDACTPWAGEVDGQIGSRVSNSNDGPDKPSMERRTDVSQTEGRVRGSADKVREVPETLPRDGAQRRLRDGAPLDCSESDRAAADESRVRTSHQSQGNGQPTREPDAVCNELGPQAIRAWRGHQAAMVRVVPFRYTGKVWCLRVPTGAFVAVRGGVAFPNGNSGFPKSLDVSKAIDKAAGAEREKVRVDASLVRNPKATGGGTDSTIGATRPWIEKALAVGYHEKDSDTPVTEAAKRWQGFGTALKPSLEPITLARKPLVGTVAGNVLEWGTGALNVDGCRVATSDKLGGGAEKAETVCDTNHEGWDRPWKHDDAARAAHAARVRDNVVRAEALGRWPANLLHDGSDEVLAAFPDAPGQMAKASSSSDARKTQNAYGAMKRGSQAGEPRAEIEKSAARFFYCPKVSKAERGEGNNHPTLKPLALMRYLCRLVTPTGGLILDPFTGSGSTGLAALQEGFRFIGCEREEAYVAIAEARLASSIKQMLNSRAARETEEEVSA